MTENIVTPRCIGCNKTPEQFPEYKYNGDGISAVEYILENDGTYDMFKKDRFYCDMCYIIAGMPIHNGKKQY